MIISRAVFKEHPLIYVSGSWHTTRTCLWSSATDIDGRASLSQTYQELERFFVQILGVETLTLQMVYDQLKQLGESRTSSVLQVKKAWSAFNSLLPRADKRLDPTPLLKSCLFPVKYPDGHVELCSTSSSFAIIDRKSHGQLFSGKAQLLDYTFDEFHQFHQTLEWAGLNTRYLSVCVKEVSAVVEALGHPSRLLTAT